MNDFRIIPVRQGWLLDEAALSPVDSGNKRRKLEAILGGSEVPPAGLITVGSVYSSHLLATAAAARRKDMPAHLIILERSGRDPMKFPHMRMAALLGAHLHVTDAEDPYEYIESLKAAHADCTWIPPGGHAESAVAAYEELHGRICEAFPKIREAAWIWLPYGTGTTACGFLRSIGRLGLSTRVMGVSVSRSRQKCLEAARDFLSGDEVRRLEISDEFAGQYELRSDETEQARLKFFRETGVLVDPIYNAKSLAILYRKMPTSTLLVNTGGAFNNIL
ncbi:pyridoxal-phosphate dependent enzyme [Luteimonas sp. MJ293]|uniref:pyridoxal-phosphate dependent enzyme n=1 Tax=Luteimonas sp. MJ146 TaxID=3129240 RepID=UPI0031B9DC2B